jgi:RHS repeat-associated protein
LYTGEFFDSHLAQYYLRARWYNPATGRFNRLDPFAGSNQDPQSLHKYLYAHCNPVNNIDSGGNYSLGELIKISALTSVIMAGVVAVDVGIRGASVKQIATRATKAFFVSLVLCAALYGATWAVHSLWTYLVTGGVVTGREAANEGFKNQSELVKYWRYLGAKGEIHHYVQQLPENVARFGKRAIYSPRNTVPSSRYFHSKITAYTNSSTETLGLADRYGYYSRLYEYIRGLSWQRQYKWGVAMLDHVVTKGSMEGFDPKRYGL